LSALWIATLLNVVGLRTGKWLHNVGAVSNWAPVPILIIVAIIAHHRFGSATAFDAASLAPHAGRKDIFLWSSIVFALAGSEAMAFLRHEVPDTHRTFPRALLLSGVICAAGYILGTIAILVILPVRQVSGMGGIVDAAAAGGARIGWLGLVPLIAAMLVVSNVGGVGAWLTATARLPFVAGIDRYLPAAFGRLHPRFGTPHRSFFWQAGLATAFILLSEAGTTVAGAYQVLVSMGIISYFLPYLFTFASLWRVQTMPAGPEVIRVPGGAVVARLLAASGFTVTAAGILLSCLPDPGEANKPFAVAKVVGSSVLLVVIGQLVYRRGARARRS
ncbi:MAG TPA: APC family permease, partial [Gemmatimonadaceae bacterium]|nr:APC family permease [Gemmatimonadaceae bacterium]